MRPPALVALALSSIPVNSATSTNKRSDVEPYAPYTTSCPAGSLIRPADSLSSKEKAYVEQRGTKAAQALSQWLGRVWGDSYTGSNDLPTIALALSGGGPKAGLTTAGAFYGLDGREESNSAVKGLLQGTTYVSALSGGTLTLCGIMANDYAKVSTLKSEFYDESYQNLLSLAISNRDQILADVGNKTAAGYPTSLIDIYGRVLAYNFVAQPPAGGNGLTWSNITSQPNFQDFEAPYPILTITQANVPADMCEPSMSASIWEVAPFDFGSFDQAVGAFIPTEYLGTQSLNATRQCTTGFDNTGFLSGVSSNILINETYCSTGNASASSLGSLASLINTTFPDVVSVNPYGIIPNPFYQSSEAGIVRNQKNLYGTDGGSSGQGIPIFPFLQPEREVDVIFIVDALSEAPTNITNGESAYNTYLAAQMKGLSKMPRVPTVSEFAAQNLSAGAHFYGCHNQSVATVIYTPNTELGNVSSSAFFYTPAQINSTFQEGLDMVTQSDDDEWAGCLACGIMHKSDLSLPDSCTACLEKYCWPQMADGNGNTPPSPTETGSPSPSNSSSLPPHTGAADSFKAARLLTGFGIVAALLL